MQNRKSVAHSLIEALKRRGIDQVFANSGTDHAPIVEALSEMQSTGIATPDFHVIPHENLAMAMAQGYYRAKGKTANTVCSLMNARRANVPVLLIAGKNPLSQEGHVGSRSVPIHWGQDAFDQNALVRDYTKWEHELRAYQNIDALIDRALTIAMSEPRGPVYLTLPRELLGDADPTEPGAITPEAVPAEPDGDAIAALADMLAASEKPAIITSTIGVDRESRLLLETIAEGLHTGNRCCSPLGSAPLQTKTRCHNRAFECGSVIRDVSVPGFSRLAINHRLIKSRLARSERGPSTCCRRREENCPPETASSRHRAASSEGKGGIAGKCRK
jgi:acetolactate synthase-1/2/3 large subunit